MAWAGEWLETNARNLQLKTAVNNGEKPPVVKDSIKEIYNSFKEVANQFSKISNAEVIGIFEKYCSPDFLEENKTVNDTFKYPITSNLYQNSVITLFNYLKNLFPDKVYEFYGIVENGKPKIRLREMPFLDNSKNIELLKTAKSINPISLMSYHLERSIEEVYTVFFAYVEGSAFSPDYYSRAEATRDGNYNAQKNEEKIRKYGYKPLQANFIGFNTEKAESVDVNNNLSKKLNVLNEQLKNAYENLDEMYTGTISVINILGEQKAEIGEYIKFLGGNFYVTDVTHSWQYSVGPRINYGIERGGFYNANGKFSKLTNITERLKELKK